MLLPNPLGRYLHLCGDDPQRIGVRVSAFPPALARASSTASGRSSPRRPTCTAEPDPRTLGEVPPELAAQCAVLVDGGPAAAGRASTVLDLSATRPVILREGALATADALALIA